MNPARLLDTVCDPTVAAADALAAAGRLRCWLDARVLELTSQIGAGAERALTDAGRVSQRTAVRDLQRAGVLGDAPQFGQALSAGDLSVDHVDVLARTLRRLEPAQRTQLLTRETELVLIAAAATPEQFDRAVTTRARALQTETDREARLAQQQANTRLRTWVDRVTGMWCARGEFDPVTGAKLQQLLDNELSARFAAGAPTNAPSDPVERNDHLRGLALAGLLTNPGRRRATRPEVLVVLRPDDEPADSNPARATIADWGIPIEVPERVLRELVTDPDTVLTTIITRGDLILHAPGNLNLARTTRLANRAQRRALQAIYPTCAIHGCTTRFRLCHIHHIHWWRHGGHTNLANLLPLCTHHHTQVHAGLLDLPPPRHVAR